MLVRFKKIILLKDLPNPIETSPWSGFNNLTKDEISLSIKNKDFLIPKDVIRNTLCSRKDHIRRIAYLVVYPDNKPITIHSRNVKWPIKDGNHRLAAAFYRNDDAIIGNII